MRYVILGAGIAAYSAIAQIRAHDPAGRVTVVSDEPCSFYYRPLIPLLVDGSRTPEGLGIRDGADISGCTVVHDRAAALDAGARRVLMAGGGGLSYDRLLIATGSSPVKPGIPGIDQPGVYTFHTMQQALSIREHARRAACAVVLGGGPGGIKAACALNQCGVKVTLVEERLQLLWPRIDERAAARVAAHLEQSGLEVLTGTRAAEIRGNGAGVRLADGRGLAADFVVCSTGISPNTAWAAGSGLELSVGIPVDSRMTTSIPDVYAAGDVAETADPVTGKYGVSALWTNALVMGRVAGANMAGAKAKYPGRPVLIALDLEGLPLITMGDPCREGEDIEVSIQESGSNYSRLVFSNDRLIGALFLGDIRPAGLYANLISSRRPLGRLRAKAEQRRLTAADLLTLASRPA